MAAFEFNDNSNSIFAGSSINPNSSQASPSVSNQTASLSSSCGETGGTGGTGTVVENIICLKIYDSCRHQDCLDCDEIGLARAAESVTIGSRQINEGEIITPPTDAASVTIDCVKIVRIVIVDKTENCFRRGFWDIDLKYVIEYRLIFRASDASIIGVIRANSIFNRKVCLFGSEGCDLFISTDLLGSNGMFQAEPFILAEAKCIGLSVNLVYDCCNCGSSAGMQDTTSPIAVEVTLGLFSIVKLFRLVDLAVESRGFSIPKECDDICPMNPCAYFDSLDFPMDLFAPPQKNEFLSGISSNIPSNRCNNDDDSEQQD